jgi:hypothetical protein
MYTAIKVEGMSHWLWFKNDNVEENHGTFTGKSGWGKGGTHTNITIKSDMIKGRIESKELQYL